MADTVLASLAERTDLSGRVAHVTGVSSGIGERAARVLAAAGATVAVAARRRDALRAQLGHHASAHRVDLAQSETPDRLVDEVVATHHQLDVVVNCAGRTPRSVTIA